ncbi:hypothetical protein HK102_004835, partial [Quaeritorhiza haematococci]
NANHRQPIVGRSFKASKPSVNFNFPGKSSAPPSMNQDLLGSRDVDGSVDNNEGGSSKASTACQNETRGLTRDCHSNLQTARFQFFEWKGPKRSKAFAEVELKLQNGQIHANNLLRAIGGGANTLYRIYSGQNVLMQCEKNGLCTSRFAPNETHQIRVKRDSVDEVVDFSDPEVDGCQVYSDFGIKDQQRGLWEVDESMFQHRAPEAMVNLLDTFLKFNDITPGRASKWYIIHTLLLHALGCQTFAPGQPRQPRIETEFPLTYRLTRQTEYGALFTIHVEYKGVADFAVRHRFNISGDATDATVLVHEVKGGRTWDDSFKNALAQAAAILRTREEELDGRGVDESGGSVYFVLTDGIQWSFNRLVSEDGKQGSELIVEEGPTLILSATKTRIDGQLKESFVQESVDKVFSWLCFVIEKGLCLSLGVPPTTDIGTQ